MLVLALTGLYVFFIVNKQGGHKKRMGSWRALEELFEAGKVRTSASIVASEHDMEGSCVAVATTAWAGPCYWFVQL